MNHILRISRIWHVSRRFRSKVEDRRAVAKIVKKQNYENKLLFGNLLESSGERFNRLLRRKASKPSVNDTSNESVPANEKQKCRRMRKSREKRVTETEAAVEFLKGIPLSVIQEQVRPVAKKSKRKTKRVKEVVENTAKICDSGSSSKDALHSEKKVSEGTRYFLFEALKLLQQF